MHSRGKKNNIPCKIAKKILNTRPGIATSIGLGYNECDIYKH